MSRGERLMRQAQAFLLAVAMFAALAALTGCGLIPERKVEYVPYEVPIPVAVPCAAQVPPEPDWAFKDLPRATPENLDLHVDALTAERRQHMGYAKKLKAAVEGCR